MVALLVECPITHRQLATGVETDIKGLRDSWKVVFEVDCPHCGQTHKIAVREAYIDGALADAVLPHQTDLSD